MELDFDGLCVLIAICSIKFDVFVFRYLTNFLNWINLSRKKTGWNENVMLYFVVRD